MAEPGLTATGRRRAPSSASRTRTATTCCASLEKFKQFQLEMNIKYVSVAVVSSKPIRPQDHYYEIESFREF